MKIVLYAGGEVRNLAKQDILIISNHRTRVDWMFLWGLAAALGRIGSLNIVLKDTLRSVPGFGWATQCFGYAFMSRQGRSQDLLTLRRAAALHGGRGRLAVLLFPEGTDLSEDNRRRSSAFAEKNGMPEYTQILHPRAAGFGALSESLCLVAHANSAAPPRVLDVTVGYVDYAPGERPSEQSIFARGRCCREVHVLIQPSTTPATAQEAEEVCRSLFAAKEPRLKQFYAPCAEGRDPDVSAFSSVAKPAPLEVWPQAAAGMRTGVMAIAALELLGARLAWQLGAVRTVLAVGVGCACFAAVTATAGGFDQILFRHAARWPSQPAGVWASLAAA